jgi:hypothetical protein
MIRCFDFILHVCICLNIMRCQLIISGKKVGYFARTEQQHFSYKISNKERAYLKFGHCKKSHVYAQPIII